MNEMPLLSIFSWLHHCAIKMKGKTKLHQNRTKTFLFSLKDKLWHQSSIHWNFLVQSHDPDKGLEEASRKKFYPVVDPEEAGGKTGKNGKLLAANSEEGESFEKVQWSVDSSPFLTGKRTNRPTVVYVLSLGSIRRPFYRMKFGYMLPYHPSLQSR